MPKHEVAVSETRHMHPPLCFMLKRRKPRRRLEGVPTQTAQKRFIPSGERCLGNRVEDCVFCRKTTASDGPPREHTTGRALVTGMRLATQSCHLCAIQQMGQFTSHRAAHAKLFNDDPIFYRATMTVTPRQLGKT